MHHSDRRIPDLRMRLPEIVCREAPGRGDACVQLGKSRLRRQEDTDLDIVGQVVAACCAKRDLRSRCPVTDPIRRPVLQYTADAAIESHSDEFVGTADRSEAHRSELQSLMRISYAVFCLKKK